ncbi:matrixin family metalloprotease [Lentilactobacillus sp. Marseille-Q4993]|uniref:matrixin family metalloprotease n=1 Tax=Lentilactobacillus sp. Marseille-Q4993 TaxID=3039492 RepID=UPI0024BCBDCC|nr:matrixin family metalloprotease [Lentilactobacillus sp. Marseille-Q4993]
MVSLTESANAPIQLGESSTPPSDLSSETGAFTHYHRDGNTITSANSQLLLNKIDKNGYTYLEKVGIAEHEIGHILGLAHSKNPRSIMSPTVVDQKISTPDINALKLIYE